MLQGSDSRATHSGMYERVDEERHLFLHSFQLLTSPVLHPLALCRFLNDVVLRHIRRDRGLVLNYVARDPKQCGDQKCDGCVGPRASGCWENQPLIVVHPVLL